MSPNFALPGLETRTLSEAGLPLELRNAYGRVPLPPRPKAVEDEPRAPAPIEELGRTATQIERRRKASVPTPIETPAPVEAPIEWATLHLLGPDSLAYREQLHLQQVRASRRASAGQPQPTFAETERFAAEFLAAITVSWNLRTPEGEDIPCTREAAADLYLRFPWIRDQVDLFTGDRTRFTSAS